MTKIIIADDHPMLRSGLIQTINREGITVLLVEQNVHQSLKLANRAYVLENGKVVLEGAGSELLDDERVREAYLGA